MNPGRFSLGRSYTPPGSEGSYLTGQARAPDVRHSLSASALVRAVAIHAAVCPEPSQLHRARAWLSGKW